LAGLTNFNASHFFWQVKGVEQEFDGDEEAELATQTE
jgi:hypothetical protein